MAIYPQTDPKCSMAPNKDKHKENHTKSLYDQIAENKH
jgi:hypothetical protein